MDEELKQLKSELRSLVVSSPSQVDVRSLLHDYRNMMGKMLPLTKYGYRDPVQFLKERCSDCFLFMGPVKNPVLTLIVPDSLKHIDKFVQKQRPSGAAKVKGKRRSVQETQKTNNHTIFKSFNSSKVVTPKKKQSVESSSSTNTSTSDLRLRATHQTPNHIVNIENTQPLQQINNNVQDKLSGNVEEINNEVVENYEFKEDSSINQSHRKKLHSCNFSDVELSSSKSDDDSGRHTSQTSSGSSGAKVLQLEMLKNEITNLMADHPTGIWCTDFMRLYREKYGKHLNYTKFGLTSILSLLYMVDDVVSVTRPLSTSDWLVMDARDPPFDTIEPIRAARSLPTNRYNSSPEPDPDDALPWIDYDPDVFPEDCMQYMESLSDLPLNGLEPGTMLEVMIGEVYSPSHFWIIRLGNEYHIAMEDVMDEMTEYYEKGEGKTRQLSRGAVRVGQYCASVYDRDWHRAIIVQVLDAETVKVRHVDYGTVETCPSDSLRPLLKRWARLPAMGVRARLADVRPSGGSRQWQHASSAHFLRLVRDKRLVARLVAIDESERALHLHLVDTSADEDLWLHEELVRTGHADANESATRYQVHLFPRFDAIEAGLTPNFAEIHRYLNDGIALQYVESYRRHVPTSLPLSPECTPATSMAPALEPPPREPFDQISNDQQRLLSVVECEVFRRLSMFDPSFAHCYVVDRITKAMTSLDVETPTAATIKPPPGF